MTPRATEPANALMSSAEVAVLEELRKLPKDYTVVVHPAAEQQDDRGRYIPDFSVSDSSGRQLLLEVKSPQSLSWSNMAKLSSISLNAHAHGRGFMVLVLDPDASSRANHSKLLQNRLKGHFENLKVLVVGEVGQLRKAVGDALNELPHIPSPADSD